jgi:hypothetical protein
MIAIVTGLLVVITGVHANADEQGWRSPACATGAITNHGVEVDTNGAVVVHVDGWSEACIGLGTAAGSEFGLLLYGETAGWLARRTDYAAGPAPTPFSYSINHTAERRYGPAVALCLAYGPDGRLSCLAVDASGNPPAITPIATDDERVAVPRIQWLCANCVNDPGDQ